MKKLFFAIACVVILCGPLPVLAGEDYPWQFTVTNMVPSGTSYWVVPYHQQRLDGKFSLGLIGDITQGVAGSGTTLTCDHASTHENPTALQVSGASAFPKLNWHSAFSAMAVDTGNTKYAYSLTTNVEPATYMVVRFISGVTNLTFTAEMTGW